MHRYKGLLISTIFLFLLVNTSYYWEPIIGGWSMLTVPLCVLGFLTLLICLMRQLYLVIKERLKNRGRIHLVIIMVALLALIAAKPGGIIDFEGFEGKDLLVARQKGVAGCSTLLKLKTYNKFTLKCLCFGTYVTRGNPWGLYC